VATIYIITLFDIGNSTDHIEKISPLLVKSVEKSCFFGENHALIPKGSSAETSKDSFA